MGFIGERFLSQTMKENHGWKEEEGEEGMQTSFSSFIVNEHNTPHDTRHTTYTHIHDKVVFSSHLAWTGLGRVGKD